jgi:hypothetical protein
LLPKKLLDLDHRWDDSHPCRLEQRHDIHRLYYCCLILRFSMFKQVVYLRPRSIESLKSYLECSQDSSSRFYPLYITPLHTSLVGGTHI